MDNNPATLEPSHFLARRRARLSHILAHPMDVPESSGISMERRRFLRQQAFELYWNELEWERLTAEEMEGGSELVENTFPGFLAFIDGLLLREASEHATVPAVPHPEVVEDILLFLSRRCQQLARGEKTSKRLERQMTLRLMDLVLYRLHDVPVENGCRWELVWADEED